MFWDGCQTFCIGLVAKWSALKPPFLNALYEKKVKLWFENNGDEKGWSLLIIFTVNSHPSVQKKILSFLNLDGNLYGFLLFFFAESLDPQVACQATFFPTLTRLLSPLPMSLGPVPLLPRLLRSSTRWPPTLNWAMNNPKIRPHAANHSNHQVIHVLIIDGAFLPLITITNCSESFDWRIGRLSWSDYSGRKTCTIHH